MKEERDKLLVSNWQIFVGGQVVGDRNLMTVETPSVLVLRAELQAAGDRQVHAQ
jgi:hypothetical protein